MSASATHGSAPAPSALASTLALAGSAGSLIGASWRLLLADLALARAAALRLLLCCLFGGLLLFSSWISLLAIAVVALLDNGYSAYLALVVAAVACLLVSLLLWRWSRRLLGEMSLQSTRAQLAELATLDNQQVSVAESPKAPQWRSASPALCLAEPRAGAPS